MRYYLILLLILILSSCGGGSYSSSNGGNSGNEVSTVTEDISGNSTVFITMTKIIINQKMVRTLIKGAILKVMMKVIVKGKQRL